MLCEWTRCHRKLGGLQQQLNQRETKLTRQLARSYDPSLLQPLNFPQVPLERPNLILSLEDESDLGSRRQFI